MNAWFSNPERIATLTTAARQWIGTPFMPNAAVKGAGVSCQKLVGSIYIEAGFLPAGYAIPEGPMDWGGAQTDSLIGKFMASQGRYFAEIPDARCAKIQPGDMVGFKFGGCVHHCGLVIADDGAFIHALRRTNVSVACLRDATFHSRLEIIWRPIESV